MRNQDILNCSFNLWYPNFKDYTAESIVLKIPQIYIDYLLTDGLFLPSNGDEIQCGHGHHVIGDVPAESELAESDEEKKAQDMFLTKDFANFKSDVLAAISELGGKIFPKLNWSSPKDASWIAVNSTLCCENFNDICLLLKSSDFIIHDLTEPFASSNNQNISDSIPNCEYYLVLRRWLNITPSGEFRCFVKENDLIAISQRSLQYHSFIESSKESIVRKIYRFYKNCIRGKFPNDSYTFDMYLPGSDMSPKLVDFNPFQEMTDGLLFTWNELEGKTEMAEVSSGNTVTSHNIVFRAVPKEGAVGPDLRAYAFPVDFQHLATGEDPAKLIDLLKIHQKSSLFRTSDSDSD